MLAVVVLVLMFSVAGKADKSSTKPVMCAGGNGTLRRISREAYEYWSRVNPKAERSLVIMLGDGYGPDVHSMSRSVKRKMLGNESYRLPLDGFLVGTSITSALGNVITDSAAGATAYANGVKTVNGAIGVEPAVDGQDLSEHGIRKCADSLGGTKKTADCPVADQESCCPLKRIANAFEGCRAKGMATGLVVTTLLPHATPAAWSSHVAYRRFYDLIARQQIEADPPLDVMMGGGKIYFDDRRSDGKDLLKEYAGTYEIVGTAQELNDSMQRLKKQRPENLKPLLALFADEDMMYEVDRVRMPGTTRQPSLAEMTEAALTRLKATGKKFCLMVEGSRIDHALHGNDAAAAAFDTFAYNDAFQTVNRFVDAERASGHQIEYISVADHSCGGITTGMQTDWQPTFSQPLCLPGGSCNVQIGKPAYGTTDGWTPEILAQARISLPQLSAQVCCNPTLRTSFSSVLTKIQNELGIVPSSQDQSNFQEAISQLARNYTCMDDVYTFVKGMQLGSACTSLMQRYLSLMVQKASRVAFTTASHTSVDINVYASRGLWEGVQGSNENDAIGRRMMEEVLELDAKVMDPISQALEECQVPLVP